MSTQENLKIEGLGGDEEQTNRNSQLEFVHAFLFTDHLPAGILA